MPFFPKEVKKKKGGKKKTVAHISDGCDIDDDVGERCVMERKKQFFDKKVDFRRGGESDPNYGIAT